MSGVTVALGTVQKLPQVPITPVRTVVQPTTWYTCPTGKKAIVKGRVACTGRGAAATSTFKARGETMFEWNQSGVPIVNVDYINRPRDLSDGSGGQYAFFEIELAAGDIIQTIQNTGTNAEFNVFADVDETPV